MDDQAEVGQVQPACCHVGGDTDARLAVAHRLHRACALVLREFAGQGHGGETAFLQTGVQMAHAVARGAEHQRSRRLEVAQHVDHGVLALARRHAHGAILDVGMRLVAHQRVDAQRVLLVFAGERGDLFRDGGREQQRAAPFGGGVQQRVQLVAEAQVEHLVGLVQHHDREVAKLQPATGEVVAEPAGRADDDVAAGLQRAAFALSVHAADAGEDARAGLGIEPAQLAMHLHGKLARRRDHQGFRIAGPVKSLLGAQQRWRES